MIHDLVRHSDVVLENYIPGTLEELGVGYAQLNAINPRIIYCAITGYGTDGPYAQVRPDNANHLVNEFSCLSIFVHSMQ